MTFLPIDLLDLEFVGLVLFPLLLVYLHDLLGSSVERGSQGNRRLVFNWSHGRIVGDLVVSILSLTLRRLSGGLSRAGLLSRVLKLARRQGVLGKVEILRTRMARDRWRISNYAFWVVLHVNVEGNFEARVLHGLWGETRVLGLEAASGG